MWRKLNFSSTEWINVFIIFQNYIFDIPYVYSYLHVSPFSSSKWQPRCFSPKGLSKIIFWSHIINMCIQLIAPCSSLGQAIENIQRRVSDSSENFSTCLWWRWWLQRFMRKVEFMTDWVSISVTFQNLFCLQLSSFFLLILRLTFNCLSIVQPLPPKCDSFHDNWWGNMADRIFFFNFMWQFQNSQNCLSRIIKDHFGLCHQRDPFLSIAYTITRIC